MEVIFRKLHFGRKTMFAKRMRSIRGFIVLRVYYGSRQTNNANTTRMVWHYAYVIGISYLVQVFQIYFTSSLEKLRNLVKY